MRRARRALVRPLRRGARRSRHTTVAPSPGLRPLQLNGIAILSGLAGALGALKLSLLGEAYGAELALPVAALAALAARWETALGRQRWFLLLAGAGIVTLLGYVASDLFRETSADQYLRGWGRIGLLLVDFACLAVITAQDRRNLWWFAAGYGLASVLYLRLVMHTPVSLWKFGYSYPITMAMACAAYFLRARAAAIGLVLLGIVSVYYDSRAHAALCFAMGAGLWLRAGKPHVPIRGARVASAAVAALVAVAMTATVMSYFEDAYFAQRRETSNVGRTIGLIAGGYIITASPLLGYGSWASHPELDVAFDQATRAHLGESARWDGSTITVAVHSQLLQAWVEGGIGGATFFLVLGVGMAAALYVAAFRRELDYLTPLLFYFLAYGLWHLVMSPFTAPHRLQIALAAVVRARAGPRPRCPGETTAGSRCGRLDPRCSAGRERVDQQVRQHCVAVRIRMQPVAEQCGAAAGLDRLAGAHERRTALPSERRESLLRSRRHLVAAFERRRLLDEHDHQPHPRRAGHLLDAIDGRKALLARRGGRARCAGTRVVDRLSPQARPDVARRDLAEREPRRVARERGVGADDRRFCRALEQVVGGELEHQHVRTLQPVRREPPRFVLRCPAPRRRVEHLGREAALAQALLEEVGVGLGLVGLRAAECDRIAEAQHAQHGRVGLRCDGLGAQSRRAVVNAVAEADDVLARHDTIAVRGRLVEQRRVHPRQTPGPLAEQQHGDEREQDAPRDDHQWPSAPTRSHPSARCAAPPRGHLLARATRDRH